MAFPSDRQAGLSQVHWHHAQEMKNASGTDSSPSCLLKISNSFFREPELFLIASATCQLFLGWPHNSKKL
jgi:hypothetical protein